MDKDLSTALGRLDRYLFRVKQSLRKGDLVTALADTAELFGNLATPLDEAGKNAEGRTVVTIERRSERTLMAIQIDELRPDQVGSWVAYTRDQWGPQKGRIKFWNQRFIFVVFHCANQWDRFFDFTAAATNPEDLDFI